jgi:hypothetical protein
VACHFYDWLPIGVMAGMLPFSGVQQHTIFGSLELISGILWAAYDVQI